MSNILFKKYQQSWGPKFTRNQEQERILDILASDLEGLIEKRQKNTAAQGHVKHLTTAITSWLAQTVTFLSDLILQQNDDYLLANESHKRGLYLWGGVGTGKTFLCELFANVLGEKVYTLHFSQFMDRLHKQMQATHTEDVQTGLSYQQARKKAQQRNKQQASIVANTVNDLIGADLQVVYIDELYIEDISDAVLLSQVFNVFAQRKLYLLITSNSPPENLYYGGLKRELFLPAIDWLQNYCRVEKIAIDNDFRSTIDNVDDFFCDTPAGNLPELLVKVMPQYVAPNNDAKIVLMERDVDCVNFGEQTNADGAVVHWIEFEFEQICATNRSYRDYVELCQKFELIIIKNITPQTDVHLDSIRRFISVIDQAYYGRCALIIQSNVLLTDFYTGNRLAFSMQRCQSRLFEMRTKQWFISSRWQVQELV